jgi:ribosomal protein L37AE/L43A
MSGRIVSVPERHATRGCEGKPAARDYPRGTIWQCDGCGKTWVVVTGTQYNEQYSAWRDASLPTLSGESRG